MQNPLNIPASANLRDAASVITVPSAANDNQRHFDALLVNAYGTAHPRFREIVAEKGGLFLQRQRILADFEEHKEYFSTATKYKNLPAAIVATYAYCEERTRELSKRSIRHHADRVAEQVEEDFRGYDCATTVIAAQMHDTKEDCGATIKDIEIMFGKEVAEYVALLTIDYEKTEDSLQNVFLKRAAKDIQRKKLSSRLNLVGVKARDNADSVNSHRNDFESGSISIIDGKIFAHHLNKSKDSVEVFEYKLFETLRHHDEMMSLLLEAGIQDFKGKPYDYAALAYKIDNTFKTNLEILAATKNLRPRDITTGAYAQPVRHVKPEEAPAMLPEQPQGLLQPTMPLEPRKAEVIDFSKRGLWLGLTAAAASLFGVTIVTTREPEDAPPPRTLVGKALAKLEAGARSMTRLIL